MRVQGHNVFAILVAAVAIYAVGFLIYGALFSAQWMALSGHTEADFAPYMWRMALSPIMPILLAIGMSIVLKWRGAAGLAAGAATGLIMAVFFVISTRLYSYVYGVEADGLLFMDAAHLTLDCLVAGAILGAWK